MSNLIIWAVAWAAATENTANVLAWPMIPGEAECKRNAEISDAYFLWVNDLDAAKPPGCFLTAKEREFLLNDSIKRSYCWDTMYMFSRNLHGAKYRLGLIAMARDTYCPSGEWRGGRGPAPIAPEYAKFYEANRKCP